MHFVISHVVIVVVMVMQVSDEGVVTGKDVIDTVLVKVVSEVTSKVTVEVECSPVLVEIVEMSEDDCSVVGTLSVGSVPDETLDDGTSEDGCSERGVLLDGPPDEKGCEEDIPNENEMLVVSGGEIPVGNVVTIVEEETTGGVPGKVEVKSVYGGENVKED